ncbi:LOW QUALITY PROTEIN: dehydrogenase/reductase SDR family member on chromosome X-like [Haliotis rubra]|uniref:LOW QUALITY PROTEIN: dehydrogenase/reductase SDR family member on chromosome X-like n=1 Tax=Haliotis rubra TaxID=36100 RepID=UPI001EE50316|nr:LOW QUALITY PROTEIN: dehydrogenase/reductase SDR family member on chromosome X-like [Haliotis rubra]
MGSSPSFPVVSLPRERIVVVTGGNTGIGYEAAKHIAMMGATVIIACRSEQRATDAIKKMNEDYEQIKADGNLRQGHINGAKLPVEFMQLDLASLKSTMDFIEAFKSSGRKLQVLLCNAGLAAVDREITEDGYELQFQVNYLTHFLIVAHLLPIMKTSGEDCRIIFTSSAAHKFARFDLDKAQAQNPSDFDKVRYYGSSKLYQIQHMFSLLRRQHGQQLTVMSFHPGVVNTEIGRHYQKRRLYSFFLGAVSTLRILRTPFQGSVTMVDAAVNPEKKGLSGVCLVDCKPAFMSSDARNEKFQEELWTYTLECLKQYLPEDVLSALEGPSS